MALQTVATGISAMAIKGLKMGAIKFGPKIGVATDLFFIAASAERQFKRDAAIAAEEPLTEDEYRALDEGSGDEAREERVVRVCCQTIRASREALRTTGIGSPIPLFSHWCLEIDGVYYELREHLPGMQPDIEKVRQKKILYQELGSELRKIKLEISTNRSLHPSTKYYEVSTTTLDDDKILRAIFFASDVLADSLLCTVSLIFRRFGSSYDLLIDNCQHFTQLLAEAISARENREDVRSFFDKRSVMKLPVAASWVAAPVYGCTMALHHALAPGSSEDGGEVYQGVGKFLNNMENFYLHPRVYAARQRQKRLFS